jgi:hypothetical protein
MDLHARDAVLHDDPSPLAVDRFGISEKRKAAFDILGVSLCLFYRKAETVPLFRARGSISELGHVLQRIARVMPFCVRARIAPRTNGNSG